LGGFRVEHNPPSNVCIYTLYTYVYNVYVHTFVYIHIYLRVYMFTMCMFMHVSGTLTEYM